MTKVRLLSILAALVLLPALLAAQGTIVTQKKAEAPGAWINHVEGKVFFQDFEKAEADKAVRPGDELVTQSGRVEIEIGDGNWVRLDRNTRVVFSDIQGSAATLNLWEGRIYLALRGLAVTVRSAQEEHEFREAGLVRIDVEKNKTEIYRDPRVADDFDGWSRDRDAALAKEDSAEATSYRRGPMFGGWAFSPFWPMSSFDWYMGFHPLWSYYDPFLWSYFSWPSWYFGWNPYGMWNSWYFGGYPFYGYYAGYGSYGGRQGNAIRRDGIVRPRDGGRQLRADGAGTRAVTSVRPSRVERSIRPTSGASGTRTGSGLTRTGSSRTGSGRTISGGSGRSSGGGSISRPTGGRVGGGMGGSIRGGGGGGRRR